MLAAAPGCVYCACARAAETLDLTEAWLRRHDSDATMARLRGVEFQQQAVTRSVSGLSPALGGLFKELYQQAIDFGGHPNERGMSVNSARRPNESGKRFDQIYLHGDGPALRFALHSAVEAGAAALGMLRLVFSERLGPDEPADAAFRVALKRGRVSF